MLVFLKLLLKLHVWLCKMLLDKIGSAQVNYYNSAAANQRSQHDVNVN